MNSIAVCAYSAGVLDGEGCVQIFKKKDRLGNLAYQATVQVATSDTHLAPYLHKYWNGYLIIRNNKPNSNPVLMWGLTGKDNIIEFLEAVIPYLTLKKDQAELIVEFCKLRNIAMKHKVGERGYSEREHEIFVKLKSLHGAQLTNISQIQLT